MSPIGWESTGLHIGLLINFGETQVDVKRIVRSL